MLQYRTAAFIAARQPATPNNLGKLLGSLGAEQHIVKALLGFQFEQPPNFFVKLH